MSSHVELGFKIRFNNEKFEFQKRYKESIEISLKNINGYLREMDTDIKRLNYYIKKNEFPINYPKKCKIYTINTKEINDSSSKYLIDGNSVLYYLRENLQYQDDIESNYKFAKDWYEFWENSKKAFQEELIKVTDIITDLRVETISYKKDLLDLDLPSKPINEKISQSDPKEEIDPKTTKMEEIISNNEKDSEIKSIQSQLRSPKRGELKELCIKFAEELELKRGEELKGTHIKKVLQKLNDAGIKSDIANIRATLNKQGFKKKSY